jgi:hypothetical protein
VEPGELTRLFERDLAELRADRRRLVLRLHPIEAWALLALLRCGLRHRLIDGSVAEFGDRLADALDQHVVSTLAMRAAADVTWPRPAPADEAAERQRSELVIRLSHQMAGSDEACQVAAAGGAWLAGHETAERGGDLDENPFQWISEQRLHTAWRNGWIRGDQVRRAGESEVGVWP